MAFDRTRLRNRYWWLGVIGLVLQIFGWSLTHLLRTRARTAGDVVWLLGLVLFFFGMKAVYDSPEMRTKIIELFPGDRTPRTL